MNYKIYYGDGSVYVSPNICLPSRHNVQVIVARNWIMYSKDWYVLSFGKWHGFREGAALADFLADNDGTVFAGKTIGDFEAILQKAKNDPLLEGWHG